MLARDLSHPTNPISLTSMSALEQKLYNLSLDFGGVTVEAIQRYLVWIKQLYIETYNKIAALQISSERISFSTVVQPLINLDIYTEKAKQLCVFSREIHVDEAVRTASTEAGKELESLQIDCEQRTEVFRVLHLYEIGNYVDERLKLHPEDNQYFKELMADFRQHGLYVADEIAQHRVAEIRKKISALNIQFMQNLNEEKTSFVMSAQALDGLPKDWFTKEREVEPGLYKITLKYPDIDMILGYATNRDTRKTLFLAFERRCVAENLPILKEILLLRNELAQLLGYKTYADYMAETSMLGDSQRIKEFLDEVNQRFTPLLKKNFSDLTDFARNYEHDSAFQLTMYDMRYYMRLREEVLFAVDTETVKQYFPEEKVINGTLHIYAQLLGLRFIEKKQQPRWQADVRYFEVYNTDSALPMQGAFYLDLYPREGKYVAAEAIVLESGGDIAPLSGISGDRLPCIAAMLGNLTKHGNLSFEEVLTFFHEFGHLMHFICSNNRLTSNNGAYTAIGFVEAPSQMLENWCYEPDVLRIISAHPQTQAPLPQDIAMKIRDNKRMYAGYNYKSQLAYAYFDYFIHTLSAEQLQELDLQLYYNQLQVQIMQLPAMPDACFPATFEHIVGGYEAGYYGYILSEIYAADMYATAFQTDPLSVTSGMRYRRCILEPGASQNGMDMLRIFLGREPRMDAFLEQCGMIKLNVSAMAPVGISRKRRHSVVQFFSCVDDCPAKKCRRGEMADQEELTAVERDLNALRLH